MGCAHGVLGNTPNSSAILPYVTALRMRLPLASLGLVRNPQTLSCHWPIQCDPPITAEWTAHELENNIAAILGPEPNLPRDLTLFASYIYANTYGRAFVTTKEGYMDLAPKYTQPGGIICILLGLQSCVLLRRNNNGKYKVVGDCFTYGLGFSEALYGGTLESQTAILQYNQKNRAYESIFRNHETGEDMDYDRRLEKILTKLGRVEDVRLRSGELVIERKELATFGVMVQDFELV
jgi:hypothetical protein